MAYELVYTSAPEGLQTGCRGFCTVAQTADMPAGLVQLAEGLSGYRHLYQPHDAQHAKNPVALAHWVLNEGGQPLSVLTRVAASGTDYSGRTNKLAHHLVLDAAERPAAGPAAVLAAPGVMLTEWTGEPRVLPARTLPDIGETAGFRADHWLALQLDAGWAGVLAETFRADSQRMVVLVFTPGTAMLPLLDDALRLLPPALRWEVAFSTYFSSAPRGSPCHWRCCLPDAEVLHGLRGKRDTVLLDLTRPLPAVPELGELVACARSGGAPAWAQPAPRAGRSRKPLIEVSADDPMPEPPAPLRLAPPPAAPRPEPGDVPLAALPPLGRGKPKVLRSGGGASGPSARSLSSAAPRSRGVPVWAVAAGAVVAGLIVAFAVLRPPGGHVTPPTAPPVAHPPVAHTPPVTPAVNVPAPRPAVAPPAAASNAVAQAPAPRPEPIAPLDLTEPVALRATNVFVRLDTFERILAPWTWKTPGLPGWEQQAYEFYGRTERLPAEGPVRDVDRLQDTVRTLTYRLGAGALSVTVTGQGVVFDGAVRPEGKAALHAVRCAPEGTGAVSIAWLRGLMVQGTHRPAAEGECACVIERTPPVALLEPWLKQARLTCQVEVRKGAPPVGATYRARPVAGGLELVVATAELEGVAAPEPDTLALAPVDVAGEGAAGRLLDYQAFGRRLAQLRESAGRNGLNLTVVKQRLVIGELRTLLEGSTRGLGAATKVNAEAVRLDERLAAAKTRIRDSARREIRQGDEDAPAEYEIPKSVDELKARASGYGRYFRAVLLPSNGLLTSQALARILEAEELDLVAEAGVASDPDEEDKPVRKRRVLETPVVADPFAVDPAPGKPAPAARAAPVRVERLLFFHPDDPRRPLLTVVVTEVP